MHTVCKILLEEALSKQLSLHINFCFLLYLFWASLVAQTVKNSPAIRETWLRSLGWEDPLEEGMVTHSNILAWRIPTDRGAWWDTVHVVAKSRT